MAINWISDRLPTIEDADEDGNVLWLFNVSLGDIAIRSWSNFQFGESWVHTPAWRNQARKIVQLLVADGVVFAVSDDGLAFSLAEEKAHKTESGSKYSWWQLPPLPQP